MLGRRIFIRKESEYVICANCKSTLIIEKDVFDERPLAYSDITPNEYYLLMVKQNSFNPYLFPKNSEFHLEPEFEKKIKEERHDHDKKQVYYKEYKPSSKYNHLLDAVNQNEKNIKDQFLKK